jgi:pimeloyl-ACP methyl ester carboxylesterase
MIGLYIILGLVCLYIVFGIIIALMFHKKMFNKRWEPDGITKYYLAQDFGLNMESVAFKRKNVTLRGYIYSYNFEKYKGIFVFSHGMWSSHKSYMQEIERLAKNGYKVLGFDYHGTDLSDGKNVRALSESLVSLDYAIRFVKENYNDDIYVMGHSWGGFAASNIAKYHPDIKVVICMAPFISVVDLVKSFMGKKYWIFIPFMVGIEFIKNGSYAFSNSINTLNKTKSRTMVLHSKDDFMVKYNYHTAKLVKKCKNNLVEFVITDKKRHNPDYTIDAVEYMISVNKELKTITDEKKKLEFRKSWDYKRMGRLDDEVISLILDFVNKDGIYNEE